MKGLVSEPRELDLTNGAQPVEGHSHGRADDAGFGERGVHYALGAELFEQAFGDAKDPFVDAHVLSHDQHTVIGAHLLVERDIQCLYHGQVFRGHVPVDRAVGRSGDLHVGIERGHNQAFLPASWSAAHSARWRIKSGVGSA